MPPNSYYLGKPLPKFIDTRTKFTRYMVACAKRLHGDNSGLLYLCNVAWEFNNPSYDVGCYQRECMASFVLSLNIKSDGGGFNAVHLPAYFPDYYRDTDATGYDTVRRSNEARMWLLAEILRRSLWAEDVTSNADTIG